MTEIKIEKGIPIPNPRAGPAGVVKKAMRHLASGEVGDSMFLPGKSKHAATSARVAAIRAAGPGWYACRSEPDGVRIWKIAEPKK